MDVNALAQAIADTNTHNTHHTHLVGFHAPSSAANNTAPWTAPGTQYAAPESDEDYSDSDGYSTDSPSLATLQRQLASNMETLRAHLEPFEPLSDSQFTQLNPALLQPGALLPPPMPGLMPGLPGFPPMTGGVHMLPMPPAANPAAADSSVPTPALAGSNPHNPHVAAPGQESYNAYAGYTGLGQLTGNLSQLLYAPRESSPPEEFFAQTNHNHPHNPAAPAASADSIPRDVI